MKLLRAKFKRVEEEFDFSLPTEPVYYFDRRRSIRIIPTYTSWNMELYNKPEELYELSCTVVHNEFETEIERFNIQVSQRAIQEFVDRSASRNIMSTAEEILHKLMNYPDDGMRTKEQFETDLEAAINKITNS